MPKYLLFYMVDHNCVPLLTVFLRKWLVSPIISKGADCLYEAGRKLILKATTTHQYSDGCWKKKVWEVQNFYEFLSVNSSVCLMIFFCFAATALLNFDSFFIFFSSFLLKLDQKLLAIIFCEMSSKNVEKLSTFFKILKIAQKNEKRLGCVLKHVILAKLSKEFTHQFR